jgi:hypothetical protein
MKHAFLLLFALALLTFVGSAQEQTVPIPELNALNQEYDARLTVADGPYLVAVAELNKKYLARLDLEKKTAQQGGKLDEAIAIDNEKNVIKSSDVVPVQNDEKSPALLKKMHAVYRTELAKVTLARDQKSKPLRDDYAKKLEELVTSLTKAGKLQEAMTVRKFRESLSSVSVAGPLPVDQVQKLQRRFQIVSE